jgi:hypothetical protein
MSFSIEARAASKSAVLDQVRQLIAAAVAGQPEHEADADKAEAVAEVYVALLGNDDSKDVTVSLSGGLRANKDGSVQNASIHVNASLLPR